MDDELSQQGMVGGEACQALLVLNRNVRDQTCSSDYKALEGYPLDLF